MMNDTCCFIGHANKPAKRVGEIILKLDHEIENLIANGVTRFISGGALGFDQIAASLIIAKKEMGKNVRLIFALPCKNQDELWNERQRALYRKLLLEADEIIYISEEGDDYMLERSAYCICALLREEGATWQAVRSARERGLKVINVAK